MGSSPPASPGLPRECERVSRLASVGSNPHLLHAVMFALALLATPSIAAALCSFSNISSLDFTQTVKYARSVYGRAASYHALGSGTRAFWSGLDLVWLDLLPPSLRNVCTWPRVPKAPGDVYTDLFVGHRRGFYAHKGEDPVSDLRVLWIYRHSALMSAAERINMGPSPRPVGQGVIRLAPRPQNQQWVEVFHMQLDYASERGAYWCYLARGSGVWMFTGRLGV